MAFFPVNFGSSDIEISLIGDFTITNNTAVTKTLTDGLSNYKYVLITQTALSDGHSTVASSDYSMYIFAPVSYFASQTSGITGYYTAGSSSSPTRVTTLCKYVSDTSIYFKQTNNITRGYKVHGIK